MSDRMKIPRKKETANEVPPIVQEVLSSSGQPLDSATRDYMEPRFGHDFSQVRIHTDERAVESAVAVNALAYTVGQDVVFGDGQYEPGTTEGKRLLTHELTHVVQQSPQSSLHENSRDLTIYTDSTLEAQAHHAAQLSDTSFQQGSLTHVASRALQKFDSYEHRILGDNSGGIATGLILLDAHKKDFPERELPEDKWPDPWRELFNSKTTTDDQKRAISKGLTYGEIVALSGDFYKDFDSLNQAPLKEIFDLIPLIRGKANTAQLQEKTGGRYLALAEQNVSHFSNVPQYLRNITVWRNIHIEAIQAAVQGKENLAWAKNAAADHFLTDAFSGGHLREQRDVLLKQGALGQVESKVLHDLDSEHGVDVVNDKGEHWVAYGDDMLGNAQDKRYQEILMEAVRLSKQDIADALSRRTTYSLPSEDKKFEAELLVPRPVDMGHDRWTGRVPTYSVGLDGTVRRTDDYAITQKWIISKEGPDYIKGLITGDEQIRNWVSNQDPKAIGREPTSEKIRMVKRLLEGIVSEEDVQAIERVLGSVSAREEMQNVRDEIDPWHVYLNNAILQTRVRAALLRTP